MKPPWWLWLVCCGLLFGGGYATRSYLQSGRDALAKVQAEEAAKDAEQERNRWRAEREWAAAEIATTRAQLNEANRREREAGVAERRTRVLLAGALSAADSLRHYPELVEALDSQIVMLTVSRRTSENLFQQQVKLAASLQSRIRTDSTELDRLRNVKLKPDTVKVYRKGAPLLRAIETLAIGTATVYACRDGLTTGCIAGSVVTLARLK